MFLFICPRNYRLKTEYFFIFLVNLLFLLLPFFLTNLIFSVRATAQTGTITGYVYKYSSTTTGIKDVVVTAYDKMNNQKGFATTNSSGKYTITNLATGEDKDYYKVCAVMKNYVRECYQKPGSDGCTKPDCGFYWKEEELTDPTQMLVDLYTKTSQSNINFYLMQGGSISGKIYGSNSNYAYRVVLEGNVQYKNRKPVTFEFYLSKTGNNFFNDSDFLIIPPGSYTLRAEDASSALKYYSTVYYDGQTGTYYPQNAKIYTYLPNQTTKNTANFYIRKGGIIWGQVFERFQDDYVGINDAKITITEKSYSLSLNVKTEIEIDPNTETVYEGAFYFSGLSPGTYILKTDDSYIFDANYRFYLPEYYNDVYFEDQATPINITEASINVSNYKGFYAQIILQHCPTVEGWVMDYNPGLCDTAQYNILNALEDITLEMIPSFQGETISVQTGSDGKYLFRKADKLLPGSYIIKARDSSCSYFSYEKTISILPSKKYTVNFCLENVPAGSGQMSISGHIFRNEDKKYPLSNVDLAAVNTNTTPYEYYYTSTNSQGKFLFDDLNCGEYNLVGGGDYEDLIKELYKGVCILDEEQFVEGKKFAEIESSATKILIYPGENLTDVDIGLSSFKYTFKKGLNLFGYPGLPVEKYDYTNEFCTMLGTKLQNFRGKDPVTNQWYVVTTSNLQSNPKKLRTGDGYMIYMNNQTGPIFYPPFKIMPPKFYQLKSGINIIAYPSSLERPIKKSSDLLYKLGTPEESACVKAFDNTSGKWKATVWLWNKPGAADFPIVQGEGYIAEMRVNKELESDPPNIAY
ncbi:MAG: hypothetical protein ACMUIU_08320 [bacterium]